MQQFGTVATLAGSIVLETSVYTFGATVPSLTLSFDGCHALAAYKVWSSSGRCCRLITGTAQSCAFMVCINDALTLCRNLARRLSNGNLHQKWRTASQVYEEVHLPSGSNAPLAASAPVHQRRCGSGVHGWVCRIQHGRRLSQALSLPVAWGWQCCLSGHPPPVRPGLEAHLPQGACNDIRRMRWPMSSSSSMYRQPAAYDLLQSDACP
jgi:hypothetical protein